MRLTRREIVRAGGLGALGMALGPLGGAAHAQAVTDPLTPRSDGWYPWPQNPVIPANSASNFTGADHRFYVTMLPVGIFTGANPVASWYMWVWTHEHRAGAGRLFTASSPWGPWTFYRTLTTPQSTSSVPLTSGPVAWDGLNRFFVAAPHGKLGTGEFDPQAPFIMKSSDGWTWTSLTSREAFRPGSWGDDHAGYTRFMTDPRGRLVRYNGSARLFFCGYHQAGNNMARLGGASSTDLVNWSKQSTPLANPTQGNAFKLGSVIHYDGLTYMTLAVGNVFQVVTTFYLKQQLFRGDPFSSWLDNPGTPIYHPAHGIQADGPYYVVSNNQNQHFMAYATATPNPPDDPRWAVDLAQRNPDVV